MSKQRKKTRHTGPSTSTAGTRDGIPTEKNVPAEKFSPPGKASIPNPPSEDGPDRPPLGLTRISGHTGVLLDEARSLRMEEAHKIARQFQYRYKLRKKVEAKLRRMIASGEFALPKTDGKISDNGS